MATMITDECINCGACEPECPNTAIYQGGVEFDALDGSKQAAISDEIFYIVPDKCTECVGFFDHEACAAVCPVDCCIPNPDIPETEDVLFARAKAIHPEQSFPEDFPSRFKADAGGDTPAADAAATVPAAAGGAAPVAAAPTGAVATVVNAEDAVAAQVPFIDDWDVPLTCFRCHGRFDVPFQFTKPGTVLHCPHCGGSFVPNTLMYQTIAKQVEKFYDAWSESYKEFRRRRRNELERFEGNLKGAMDKLRGDVEETCRETALAGSPQRDRGVFG